MTDSRTAPRTDLAGRTIVVTGASLDSLGYATALVLGSWGARVLVSTRSETAAAVDSLAHNLPPRTGSLLGHSLDLCDSASVTAFAEWVTVACDGRLDALINNAGVHLDLRSQWKQPHLTPDGVEIHWRTNYLGSAQLTALLMPALQSAAAGTGNARVVNVVSKLHRRATNVALFAPVEPYNSWTAYGASKLAMMHAANEIERRYASDGVHGYALHPGSVFTKIADKGLEGNRLLSSVRRALSPIEKRMLLTPVEGAQTSVYCATEPDLAGGRYYRDCAAAEASPELDDRETSARLWNETESWLSRL
jgi:retinol dehydrogenase 12